MQAIDINKYCTLPLMVNAPVPREDLTVNMTVDSFSKYLPPHLLSDPRGSRTDRA